MPTIAYVVKPVINQLLVSLYDDLTQWSWPGEARMS